MSPEEYELKKTDISETNPSNAEWANVSELDKFFDNDSIKANQEIIESVLNKEENKSLKEWFENFLLKEKNTIKKNAIKQKLSKATDELTVKSIIAEVVEWWYKVWDKKNVWEDMWKWENIKEWESIWGEKPAENQNWNLEDALQQTVQNEEEAVQNEEEAVQNENKGVEKWKNLNEHEALRNAIEERDRLVAKYQEQNLDAKTNQNSENYQKVKKQLENNWVLNQLRQTNHDDQFINNYILVQATLQELKSNPTNYEQSDISYFDKVVKNLNNSCNIPDTNLSSFSKENIAQTRTELFNSEVWNDSLISAKKSNMESHDYSEIFPEKIEADELIAKYGNFLEWNLKTFWQNYKNNPNEIKNKVNEIKNNPNPTDEDKRFLQNYNYMIAVLDKKRKETEEKTKNMMEELCIISQIKWMYMCMWEWENFNLNKAKEIESENWILTLRWHIDWVDFVIRQDTTKESPLQISSKLYKNNESLDDTDKNNDFIIWWKDKFVNSNFILPTQDEIFTMITENIKSDNLLQNADNYEKYLQILQNNIMVNIDNKYEKTKYAHHYMQEQVKWEKIIDKTISFVEKLKGADIDSRINNSSAQLYNFLNLMDFNIKHSTSAEKDKLYRIMDKIDRMTGLAQYNSSDWELIAHQDKFSQYLTGDSLLNTRSTLKGNQVEWSNKYAFDLFKNYENLSDERKFWGLHMINFDQMLVDLNKVEIQQKEKQEKTTWDLALSKLDEDLEIAYA